MSGLIRGKNLSPFLDIPVRGGRLSQEPVSGTTVHRDALVAVFQQRAYLALATGYKEGLPCLWRLFKLLENITTQGHFLDARDGGLLRRAIRDLIASPSAYTPPRGERVPMAMCHWRAFEEDALLKVLVDRSVDDDTKMRRVSGLHRLIGEHVLGSILCSTEDEDILRVRPEALSELQDRVAGYRTAHQRSRRVYPKRPTFVDPQTFYEVAADDTSDGPPSQRGAQLTASLQRLRGSSATETPIPAAR